MKSNLATPFTPTNPTVLTEIATGFNSLLNRLKSSQKQLEINGEILWKWRHEVHTVVVSLYCFQMQKLVKSFISKPECLHMNYILRMVPLPFYLPDHA